MAIATFKELINVTNSTMCVWKEYSRGYAPDEVADKLDNATLEWISSLTETLDIWLSKGLSLTQGELILARTNMGSLVESWLKFFYCVYLEDYRKSPKVNKSGAIDPDEKTMRFEDLKQYSRGILWESGDKTDKWIDKIQGYRNAIHSFQPRAIGTPYEFIEDFTAYCEFVELILDRLPPIEDNLELFYQ